jgi:pyrroloquinoline quinone (PQQ) biosynthesis protein C
MGELGDTLLACAHARPIGNNIFIRRLCKGEYSREELRPYGQMIFRLSESFPMTLAAILSICPRKDLRVHLLKNLFEEEGMVPCDDGRGFVYDPERRHSEIAKRFTRALSIPDENLDLARSPNSTRWLDRALRERRWLPILAYITVGIESNIPRTFKLIVPALRRFYGFSDHQLAFLIEHIEADEAHGSLSAEIIACAVGSPADRKEALEGVRRGSTAWWQIHRACDNHFTEVGGRILHAYRSESRP